ncbi:MAG: HlyD family efflux transporter periplasmic adaptor subunit [Chitinophagaceae bacterium]|nr:HlyD family efflux transporter periplasmic adaptor subunit [Chitinophagaceae bacterium]
MDTVIKKKKWTLKRILWMAAAIAIIAFAVPALHSAAGSNRLNVHRSRIVINEVIKGSFREYIPVTGIVQPVTTIYLDAAEGGRVEEKYADDGAMVKKDAPILRLSNTDLELNLVNQETSVFNLLTQMQISQNAARQNTIAKLNQMADVDNTFKEAERVYLLNKELYREKVISGQEFRQSQIAYDYQVKKKALTEQILRQDSLAAREEMEQTRQSYQRTQNALEVMRKKVGDLIVRAPVDGQLTALDAEIGQNKNKGERLGQIDVLRGFKIRANIDEHYISRIFTGLKAEFNFNDTMYGLVIKKVYAQVASGQFQVDMQFTGAIPGGIRRGQTLQVRLTLSDAAPAVMIPRGGYYEQTGGNWIFKIDGDRQRAYKAPIETGRQNPEYYEIISGLKPGDKVITSTYNAYEKKEELILQDD